MDHEVNTPRCLIEAAEYTKLSFLLPIANCYRLFRGGSAMTKAQRQGKLSADEKDNLAAKRETG
jgi:hypothetical protein